MSRPRPQGCVSRPRPRRGGCLPRRGVQAQAWGLGGLSRPGGVCVSQHARRQTPPAPSRRLLLRAVHILLECILVFSINLYCTFSFRWEETTSTNETRRRHGNRQYMSWRYIISTRYSNILHWALTFHSTRLSLENLATCCIPFSLMRKGLTLFFLAVKKIIS